MRRIARFLVLLLALAALPVVSRADGRIGVVLMHGKQGAPGESPLAYIVERIEQAGFLMETPTMCWTQYRIYDHTLVDCLADVDAAIGKLNSRGATAIVVAGHSLGGVGTLAYGSLHRGLKGIIVLAPAPPPRAANQHAIEESMAEARNLIAAGRGDEFRSFTDINNNAHGATTINVRATPNIFASFWDMNGLANLSNDAAKVSAPVFWASGTHDQGQLPREHGFDRAPANPLSRYLEVSADHMGTPDAAADAAVAWLRELARSNLTALAAAP